MYLCKLVPMPFFFFFFLYLRIQWPRGFESCFWYCIISLIILKDKEDFKPEMIILLLSCFKPKPTVLWFNSCRQIGPMKTLAHSPQCNLGDNLKWKSEKTCCVEIKKVYKIKKSKIRNSSTTFHYQADN